MHTQKFCPPHGDHHETVFLCGTGFFAGTAVGLLLVDRVRTRWLQQRTNLRFGPRLGLPPGLWRNAGLVFEPKSGLAEFGRGQRLGFKLGYHRGLGQRSELERHPELRREQRFRGCSEFRRHGRGWRFGLVGRRSGR
jgi:hypothetical protein